MNPSFLEQLSDYTKSIKDIKEIDDPVIIGEDIDYLEKIKKKFLNFIK